MDASQSQTRVGRPLIYGVTKRRQRTADEPAPLDRSLLYFSFDRNVSTVRLNMSGASIGV